MEGLVEKIVNLVKKILFLVTTAGLLTFLLKYLKYGLELKRFLLEVGYLILKAVKVWFWIKQAKEEPHIIYTHKEHDHFIPDHHEVIHHEGPHGEDFDIGINSEHHPHPYWGREDRAAHHMAFRNQKPLQFTNE